MPRGDSEELRASRNVAVVISLIFVFLSVVSPIPFAVTAAAPNLAVAAVPSTILTFGATTVTATVTGSSGQPQPDIAVIFNSSGLPGSFSSIQAVTNNSGQATVSWTAGGQPGIVTIFASAYVIVTVARPAILLSGNVTVTVQNQSPTARIISFSPSLSLVGQRVNLTLSGSDPDGTVVTYELDWGDGSPRAGGRLGGNNVSMYIDHVYAAVGRYMVNLRVLDNLGAGSSWTSVAIDIVSPNQPPMARIISFSPSPGVAGQPVTFTISGSDLDGIVRAYELDWGDNSTRATGKLAGNNVPVDVDHIYAVGRYAVDLRVLDNLEARSAWTSVVVDVVSPNQPPTGYIDSVDPSPSMSGETVTFVGHGADKDGKIVAYRWISSIDGELGSTASLSISKLSLGVHTVTFQVQDNGGLWSNPVTMKLQVEQAMNLSPVAYIDQIAPSPANQSDIITFIGHGSDPNGDRIVGFSWVSSIDGQLSDSDRFSTRNLTVGRHTIFFKVQDERGAWSKEYTLNLTVNPRVEPASGGASGVIVGGLAAVGAVGAGFVGYTLTHKKPSTSGIERELERESGRESRRESDEDEKRKKDIHRIVWSVTAPSRSFKKSFTSVVRIKNQGTSAVEDLRLMLRTLSGITAPNRTVTYPRIKPNESVEARFLVRVEDVARRGVYNLAFTLEGKQVKAQIKRHFVRLARIALISGPGDAQLAKPISQWLNLKKCNWETIPGADDFTKLLRFDMVITRTALPFSSKASMNLTNYVEEGQSLIVVGSLSGPGQEAIAAALGYSSGQVAPLKLQYGTLTIIENGHQITKTFDKGHKILLGVLEGNCYVSQVSTGSILASIGSMNGEMPSSIAGIVVNTLGKGRTVSFNLPIQDPIVLLGSVFEDALEWLLFSAPLEEGQPE